MPVLLAGLAGTLLFASLAGCGSDEETAEEKEDTLVKVATRRALAKEFADPTVQAQIRQSGAAHGPVSTEQFGSATSETPDQLPGAAPIGCGNFRTWLDVQFFYVENGGPEMDTHYLDTNSDGIACNSDGDQGIDVRQFGDDEIPSAALTPHGGLAPSGTPEDQPPQGLNLAEAPLRNYTASEIGAFPWTEYRRDGFEFVFAEEGESIYLLAGRHDLMEQTCGPHIGSSLDARMSQTWVTHGHFIWVWGEGDFTGCVAVSKFEDWFLMDAPRLEIHGTQEMVEPGDTLVYFGDVSDRSYSMPPNSAEGVLDGDAIETPSFKGLCDVRRLPAAAWTVQRGFVGISPRDLGDALGLGAEELHLREMAQARAAGWFYVWFGEYPPEGENTACWRIGNKQIPEEPCLHCQLHLLKPQTK